jgi:hypothetical protein
MSRQSLVEIMTEYFEVVDEIFGFYLDSVTGYNYLLEQFTSSQQKLATRLGYSIEYLDTLSFSYGHGDPNLPDSHVFHDTTQGEFKSRIQKNGPSYYQIAQLCLSQIYQYWEDHYREQVAESLNLGKNEIKVDIFGDLRLIRNSIIHNRGYAMSEIVKCKKITWLKPGEPIWITEANLTDIVGWIKADLCEL